VPVRKEKLVRWISVAALALVVTLASLFVLTPASAQAPDSAVAGKVICIDPGHGGAEAGAVYDKRGRPEDRWTLYEKEINLDVAQALRGLLVGDGATVVMTRTKDIDVVVYDPKPGTIDRVDICNGDIPEGVLADITVSVHTNSTYSARWDGSMTLVAKDSDWSLAEVIHPIMYQGLKENWEGLFTDYGVRQDVWTIPLYTDMPAVILEPVFMSNHDEAEALKPTIEDAPDGRRAQIAQVAYEGIVAYFESISEPLAT
jgi:N-acetylmuramoyl-L-alanine amidase